MDFGIVERQNELMNNNADRTNDDSDAGPGPMRDYHNDDGHISLKVHITRLYFFLIPSCP